MGTFPERVLGPLNRALTALFDALAAPLIRVAPLSTLLVVSVLTGIALLWVVKRTSNQAAVITAKRAIQAGLFEIRLFNDDLGAVLRALGRVLSANLRYLGHALVPLAWAGMPLLLVVAQLQAFYGYAGLQVGSPVVLTMRLGEEGARRAAGGAALETPDGVRAETPAVMLPGAGEVLWRLVPGVPGAFAVTARVDGFVLTKTMDATVGVARRSPVRGRGLATLLLHPSESPLPADGPVDEISIRYEEPGLDLLGWRVHWMIVYVAVSMITAFALAKRFGVTL